MLFQFFVLVNLAFAWQFAYATPNNNKTLNTSRELKARYIPPTDPNDWKDVYVIRFLDGHDLETHLEFIGKNLTAEEHELAYDPDLKIYRARLDEETVHNLIRLDPGVDFVRHDKHLSRRDASPGAYPYCGMGGDPFNGSDSSSATNKRDHVELADTDGLDDFNDFDDAEELRPRQNQGPRFVVRKKAPYHLAMINSGYELPMPVLDGKYSYQYERNAGQGVFIYVLDSGVRRHYEFADTFFRNSRVVHFIDNGKNARYCPRYYNPRTQKYELEIQEDLTGHGTAVASIAAGKKLGAAPKATIVNVKIYNRCGDSSDALTAMALNRIARQIENYARSRSSPIQNAPFRGAAIVMAWGDTSVSPELHNALIRIRQVRTYTTSAPGSVPIFASAPNRAVSIPQQVDYPCIWDEVICVSSVGSTYQKSSFAAYGPGVGLWAPGEDVTVAKFTLPFTGTRKSSGTSFSAPLAAGVAAAFLSWKGSLAGQQNSDFEGILTDNEIRDSLSNLGQGSNNVLLNNGVFHPAVNTNPAEPFVNAGPASNSPLRGSLILDAQKTFTAVPSSITPRSVKARALVTSRPADSTETEEPSETLVTTDPPIPQPTLSVGPVASAPTPSSSFAPGVAVSTDLPLRILCVGDSITWGVGSSDNKGYREKLRNLLSADKINFAGTVTNSASMSDNYMEGYRGRTIQYISDHIDAALDQEPNVVLLMAGMNDMNPDPNASKEGSDPVAAINRLGKLVDKIQNRVPGTAILVAKLNNVNDNSQHASNVAQFNRFLAPMVTSRLNDGIAISYVDMSSISGDLVGAGDVHPNDEGFGRMADIWYQGLHAIPDNWITECDTPPPDPRRLGNNDGLPDNGPGNGGGGGGGEVPAPDPNDPEFNRNGGLDPAIPYPNYGKTPIVATSPERVRNGANSAYGLGARTCPDVPSWEEVGLIAPGYGTNGAFKLAPKYSDPFKLTNGFGLDGGSVRFHDIDGNGFADYVHVDAKTGAVRCWLTHFDTNSGKYVLEPAGDGGLIYSGGAPGQKYFFADLNGNRKADLIYLDGDTGAFYVSWNRGPNPNEPHGWSFYSQDPGHRIFGPQAHANYKTSRFTDLNGDGRADFVIVGKNGSLRAWINTGRINTEDDPRWVAFDGIATGAVINPDYLILSDIDGDRRADYLIADTTAGLSGFLSSPTLREGVPLYISQGGPKSIAAGINKSPKGIRLADVDGDGRPDYIYVGESGDATVYFTQGFADTHQDIDGVVFADMDGDGLDDYVYLDYTYGSVALALNKGPQQNTQFGWQFQAHDPVIIASGASAAPFVKLADMNGDGKADYVLVNPFDGSLGLFLNLGPDSNSEGKWRFNNAGIIAPGLGLPGINVRLADVDGDGRADYIYLGPNGNVTVFRNVYNRDPSLKYDFEYMPSKNFIGFGDVDPRDIIFADVDGDNLADYIVVDRVGGRTRWAKNLGPYGSWGLVDPILHGYLGQAQGFDDQGIGGRLVHFAKLLGTNRADLVLVDPFTGGISVALNKCNREGDPPCRAPLKPSGVGNIVYWESVTSDPIRPDTPVKYGQGITNLATWNIDYVSRRGPGDTQENGKYRDGIPGFQVGGNRECFQNGQIYFFKSCDASIYNVYADYGTVGYCVKPDGKNPAPLTKDNTIWYPKLVCQGTICQT